jgi:hypothetical protein
LKDEEAIDWRGGFWSFHWTRGTSSRKGHGRFTKRVDGLCFLKPKGTKEEEECVRKNISSYVWKKVVHGKNMCKQRAWKEVVCNKLL